MKIKRYSYRTLSEKTRDFALGFFGWVVITGILLWAFFLSSGYVSAIAPLLFLSGNILTLIYFERTRQWIAIGAVSALMLAVVLVVITMAGMVACVFFFCVF